MLKRQKPGQWGPLSAVRAAALTQCERVWGIDSGLLRSVIPFWEMGGVPIDLIPLRYGTLSGGTWQSAGLFLDGNTGTGAIFTNADSIYSPANRMTVCVSFTPTATPNNYDRIVETKPWYGAKTGWAIDLRTAGNKLSVSISTGNSWAITNTSWAVGSQSNLAFVYPAIGDDTTRVSEYSNGRFIGNIYANFTGLASTTTSLFFGKYAAAATNEPPILLDRFFLFSEALSADQIAAINDNPYALLQRPHARTIFDLAAGGGATVEGTCADGISLGDSAARIAALLASSADGVALGDAPSRLASLLASAADGILGGDAGGNLAALLATAADGTVYSDTAAGEVSSALIVLATCADGIVLSHAALARADLTATASDAARLGEAVSAALQAVALAADGILLSGLTTWAGVVDALAEDGITLSDAVSRALRALVVAADGVTLSDTGAARADLTVACADGVQLIETLAALATMGAVVADGVRLGDSTLGYNTTVLPTGEVRVTFTARAAAVVFTVRAPGVTFTNH